MNLIKAHYQHREGGTELVDHQRDINLHREACEIIDNYPWVKELELFEELDEGGGLLFVLGDYNSKFASYQFIPVEKDAGLLDLEIVIKPGFLNIFGRNSVSVSFDLVSIPEAKQHIKELFNYSIDSLYNKHKK